MKWTRAAPAKYDRLAACFIHDPVAFQTARHANRLAFHVISCNQRRIRSRTEPLRTRYRVGRNKLNHAQSVFAIGYERELRCVHTADLYCTCVVQGAARIKHLVNERPLWILNIDNRQALRPVRNIGVSARDIQSPRISQSNRRARNGNRSCRFGKIDNLQPVIISDESVAELDCDAARISQKTIRQFADNLRTFRIMYIDDEQSARRGHVEPMPRRSDKRRPGQNAARIEANGFALL